MKIILKYKKIFIAVVLVSLLIAVIPVLSMIFFMADVTTNFKEVEVDFNNYESSLPAEYEYQSVNLKMDSQTKLEQPDWNDNYVQLSKKDEFSNMTTKQKMVQEWYLEEGTSLSWRVKGNAEVGYVEYCLLSEEGVEEYLELNAEGGFKVKKSGNYGVLLNANFFEGSSTLYLELKK